MESEGNVLRVDFPNFSGTMLQKLNQQRQRGQLCDIIVVIQGHQYRAHRAILAASSPYFCDQVLLKNSARCVLPDVMHPCVFERLLLSCYTGTLHLPAGEVVAFLTAASFLQMWHVVDKCTELLEVVGSGASTLVHKSSGGLRDRPFPGDSSYHSPGDGSMGLEDGGGGGAVEGFAKMEMDQLLENSFSPPTLENNSTQPSGSCSPPVDHDGSGSEVASQDGDVEEGGEGDYQYSRPAYVPPSIMGHRKWVHVKSERRADCKGDGALFSGDPAVTDPEQLKLTHSQASASRSSLDHGIDEKPVAQLEESLEEDPLDFYGTSIEGFSTDKADGTPLGLKDNLLEGATGVEESGGGGEGTPGGLQEETSHSGFASVVYKLYPCQCGKSFTHKSQRDRHMSMHLGLRPYGCAVCGKSFKMKHHLVGHMKIHTGVKPYECSLCAKRFMWRDSFNRHTSSCTRVHQARCAVNEQAAQIC
ncbi:zinc finger and BTB domain-containing protein 43 [Oncorhynchus tshawytscha]|uniref:Zinc finger and BTB domain containing 43 n=1 Tax=Oncorhynchus tshawytscha TaxID=74940 RepID=A0AAZ3RWH1_ONCTS|nr:zinc finger and BTB domain-containing protein 43 [Oncorhynchus tshawytscha]